MNTQTSRRHIPEEIFQVCLYKQSCDMNTQTSRRHIPEEIIFQVCLYKQSRDMNTQTSRRHIPEEIIFQVCLYKQSRDMNTQSIIIDWCQEGTANTHSVWIRETDTYVLWNISCERFKCKPQVWIKAELPAVSILLHLGTFCEVSLVMSPSQTARTTSMRGTGAKQFAELRRCLHYACADA